MFCIFAAYQTPSVTQHYLKASINFGAFLLNNLQGNVFFVGLRYILILVKRCGLTRVIEGLKPSP